MKTLLFGLGLAVLITTGCAQRYTITTSNGTRLSTKGKPKLVGGSYVYTDARGQKASVPSVRVREIAPASESNSNFEPGSSK